jgi:hypothetical protein
MHTNVIVIIAEETAGLGGGAEVVHQVQCGVLLATLDWVDVSHP